MGSSPTMEELMTDIDVSSTAETIEAAAETLERAARDLRHQAAALRETKDFDRAAFAVNTLVNIWANVRLDLLISKPVRELRRHL